MPAVSAETAPAGASRFHVHAVGSLPAALQAFCADRRFQEFAEEGRLRADYAAGRGLGGEVGLQLDLSRRFAIQAALGVQARDDSAHWSARLPHPLYLDHDREASGEAGGLRHTETASHLDVVLALPGRRFTGAVFAGPSVLSVKAALLRAVEYDQAYPYDTVAVRSTPTARVSGHGYGFNAGAALAWAVGPRIDVLAHGRYAKARVRLAPAAGDTVGLDAGGLTLGVGARLSF